MRDDAETLLQRARAGNLVAQQQLILREHTALMGLIRSDLRHTMRVHLDPEDVLQEVYVELIRSFDAFSGDRQDTFASWARTVARNKVREAQRRQLDTAKRGASAKRVRLTGPFSQTSAPLAAALEAHMTTVSGKAVRIEAIDALAAALALLPEHYRQVLELQYLLELPVDEVARRMNRSRGSVLMTSHRAKRQMADLMRQFPLLTKS
ncbi:MAG: sigma-70 family RNA polymerase sigma factor [Planctomycetota bacterium]